VSGVRRGTLAAFVAAGLALCVALALLVAPRASSQPDGLERVAQDEGFAARAEAHALEGLPTAGYAVEGVDDEGLSTGLAGVLGIGTCFALGAGAVLLLRRRRPPAAPAGA